jgi:hypothetical protein
VLNPFKTRDGLAAAAIDAVAASLKLPTTAIFTGARGREERLRRLASALYSLYERSEPWFMALEPELSSVQALRRREQQFWADLQQLYSQALGKGRASRRLEALVAGLTSPATFGALKDAGLSSTQAAQAIGDALTRAAQQTERPPARGPARGR